MYLLLMKFRYFYFTVKQDKLYYIYKQLDVLLISILGSSKACFYVSVNFSDPS